MKRVSMANKKQPSQPKSTEEILREMEAMVKDGGTDLSSPGESSGGGLKSLLNFFVKVVPEEEEALRPKPSASHPPTPSPQQHTGPRVSDLVAGESSPKFSPPPAAAGDLAQKPFAEIYREAGI